MSPRVKCKTCYSENTIKKGWRNKTQKLYCKACGKHFQSAYSNLLCTTEHEKMIILLNNEGMGISSISRITGISKANVINRIRKIAAGIEKPTLNDTDHEYEADELITYIQNKSNRCFVMYAINKKNKNVVDVAVGQRTKENIAKVIKSVNALKPKVIFTDRLNIYPGLIEKTKHVTKKSTINHIERFNLTLRTHLKRLSRKSICFSKNIDMLTACVKIYFWADDSVPVDLYFKLD